MKFGVREICDVVFRAKATMTIGNRTFFKHEPVIYFDTLKTSGLEGASTTVYAQGGRGNTRLIAWEGERAVTFTMEDALISPLGFAILSGAGIVEAETTTLYQHFTEQVGVEGGVIKISQVPYVDGNNHTIYVMVLDDNGDVTTEPYIYTYTAPGTAPVDGKHTITLLNTTGYKATFPADAKTVLVDYYVAKTSGMQQIEIAADSFGGNFYIEASTLFRNQQGQDLAAEFIIPNAKVQSNFNFTMASSGDPSTFTFTMDAFPDYTRWNPNKKVLCAIQVVTDTNTAHIEGDTRVTTEIEEDGVKDTVPSTEEDE